MPPATAAPPKLSGKDVQSYLMRTTGPQPFFTQSFATLSTFNIPKNLPLQLPLAYIQIRWKGRIAVATAAATPSPEAPQNILQRIQLQGTHATLGTLMPIQMSGATLFQLNRIFGVRGNSVIINGNRYVQEGQSQLGLANAATAIPGYPQFGSIANFDTQIFWTVPVFPYNVVDGQAVQYLFNPASWGQTLQLQIVTADATAFNFLPANTTFSAFGSATGSPAIDIMLVYASLGPLRNSISQAVSVKNVFQINTVLQSNANNLRLQLLQNQRTLNVMLKTGTSLAGTSAGVSAFGTLSDTITEQEYLRVNNNPIRNLQYHDATKEYYGYRFDTVIPQGYQNISFSDSNPAPNAFAGFKGERLPGSAQFDLASNVVGAAGTNIGEVVQDMIYGEPQVAAS